MLRKNVKSLLEQLQVCIFAEIVFGVRCTLTVPLPSLNQAAYQGQFYLQCHSTLYITDILGYLAFNVTQNSNVHFYL